MTKWFWKKNRSEHSPVLLISITLGDPTKDRAQRGADVFSSPSRFLEGFGDAKIPAKIRGFSVDHHRSDSSGFPRYRLGVRDVSRNISPWTPMDYDGLSISMIFAIGY